MFIKLTALVILVSNFHLFLLTDIPFWVGVGVLVLLAEAFGVFVLLVPGVTEGVS